MNLKIKQVEYNLIGNRNLVRLGKHPEYKNISVFHLPSTLEKVYYAHLKIGKENYSKSFLCDVEARKWVDLQCIKNNIKQKNNSYAKKVF